MLKIFLMATFCSFSVSQADLLLMKSGWWYCSNSFVIKWYPNQIGKTFVIMMMILFNEKSDGNQMHLHYDTIGSLTNDFLDFVSRWDFKLVSSNNVGYVFDLLGLSRLFRHFLILFQVHRTTSSSYPNTIIIIPKHQEDNTKSHNKTPRCAIKIRANSMSKQVVQPRTYLSMIVFRFAFKIARFLTNFFDKSFDVAWFSQIEKWWQETLLVGTRSLGLSSWIGRWTISSCGSAFFIWKRLQKLDCRLTTIKTRVWNQITVFFWYISNWSHNEPR